MAIQVGGTTVINDSRQLQNIASIDSATSAIISSAANGVNDYYDFTTTSLSPTVDGGSSPYVGFQSTTTYPAGAYEIALGEGGPGSPWWSVTTSSRSKLPGPNDYFGQAVAICAKIGSGYYPLRYYETLADSASTDYFPSLISSYFNNPNNNLVFTMTSSFSIALCFGTYSFTPQSISSPITAWGNRGSYKIDSGSSFGWVIRDAYAASGPTS